ncbi:MAG: CRISPR-associated endonuclease Cas2 [Pseudomonadota bacterium]|nr:CRISPR-associated endonuclease Cas2 [Rhodocyclaceae bacterium]
MSDFILCYDISDPKRLGRVFRFLKKRALPLQYSVFLFSGDERQLDRVLEKLVPFIDAEEDDLRAYPLPQRGFKARLGRAALPEGIQWSNLPATW